MFSTVPGKCNAFQYTIQVNTKEPIVKKQYPIPLCYRDQVRQKIKAWLDLGITEPSIGKHHHPLVVVKKKGTDEVRICPDLTELNCHTPLVNFKVERLDYLFGCFSGMKYSTSLDLFKSYL